MKIIVPTTSNDIAVAIKDNMFHVVPANEGQEATLCTTRRRKFLTK